MRGSMLGSWCVGWHEVSLALLFFIACWIIELFLRLRLEDGSSVCL